MSVQKMTKTQNTEETSLLSKYSDGLILNQEEEIKILKKAKQNKGEKK